VESSRQDRSRGNRFNLAKLPPIFDDGFRRGDNWPERGRWEMTHAPDSRPPLLASVIVRIGVNLQPGQSLFITEPYELHGVHPETAPLVEALRSITAGHEITVSQGDPLRLRTIIESGDERAFEALVSGHVWRMERHLANGGAFVFLLGSQPHLMSGLPAERLSRFDRIKWRHLGPVIRRLVRGASQWTLAPAPSATWAEAVYHDLPPSERLPALWRIVSDALRASAENPINAWRSHLSSLARRRDELNAARHQSIRYVGPGTDLTLDLPRAHVWCTAQRQSAAGIPFVANLPTEEIFTAPHKKSATGRVRVAGPVSHGGAVIEGIELEFKAGRVVQARARIGADVLQQLLATDGGACRIGEIALVPGPNGLSLARRHFHHTLLDENAANHIALGDAYRFCNRALLPLALNSSQVHLDLPIEAQVTLTP
jgi:aminopeptidase